MTKQQKDLIIQMRGQKQSYSTIAEQLGISVNTVSSFCRRNALDGDCKDIGGTGFCKNCGRLFKSKKGHRPRQFCSDNCRLAWWNTHPDQVKRGADYSFICASCGREFSAYGNRHRKYCSHACYIAGRYGQEVTAHD